MIVSPGLRIFVKYGYLGTQYNQKLSYVKLSTTRVVDNFTYNLTWSKGRPLDHVKWSKTLPLNHEIILINI